MTVLSGCLLYYSRIDHMIDPRHPLAALASHRPWQEIGASLPQQLARKVRKIAAFKRADYLDPISRSGVVVYPRPDDYGYPFA